MVSGSDKKQPQRRRQVNIPPNTNFQPQQFPQQLLPTQQQQLLPNPEILPNQQQPFNPNYNQMSFPSSATFQNGQVYPTMDPQFSVQAQVSAGPNGNGKKAIHNLLLSRLFHLSCNTCRSINKSFTIHRNHSEY
jgi:hypothetical protein